MKEEIPALFQTCYFEIIFVLALLTTLNDLYNWLPPLREDDDLSAGELQYRRLKQLSVKISTVGMGGLLLWKYIILIIG